MNTRQNKYISVIVFNPALAFVVLVLIINSLNCYAVVVKAYFHWTLHTTGTNSTPQIYGGTVECSVGEPETETNVLERPEAPACGRNVCPQDSCWNCCPGYYKSARTVLKIRSTNNAPIPSIDGSPIWLFSQNECLLRTITTTSHMASESCDCADTASASCLSDVCYKTCGINKCFQALMHCMDEEDEGSECGCCACTLIMWFNPVSCWICFGPFLLPNCIYKSCQRCNETSSTRYDDVDNSKPHDLAGCTVFNSLSVASNSVTTASGQPRPLSIPANTLVINLLGSNDGFRSWLEQACDDHSITDVPIIIPGFVHTPITVDPSAVVSQESGGYSFELYPQNNSLLNRIYIEVLSDYSINVIRITGPYMEFELRRTEATTTVQPRNQQPINVTSPAPSAPFYNGAPFNNGAPPPPYTKEPGTFSK